MVCTVKIYERPKIQNPVLIEGLPGIGFVANISALHLIHKLDAKLFAEIGSSSFQDLAVTTETGSTLSPINQIYYHRSHNIERDLIIWYGNTQALTTFGQYELCGRVLDLAQEMGCECIITLGGFRREETKHPPKIYCAASDLESLETAKRLGAEIMVGQIYGLAGITIGLARLRNLKAFSLLVETPGTHPDAEAAQRALEVLIEFLSLKISLEDLDKAIEETRSILKSFGLVSHPAEQDEKEKKGTEFRWYV